MVEVESSCVVQALVIRLGVLTGMGYRLDLTGCRKSMGIEDRSTYQDRSWRRT